jgi:molecular chaperone Hsp33
MIRASIDDVSLRARLDALPPDGITIFTLGGGRVRGALLHGSRLVNQMRANHRLGPLETMILGQACLGATLMGAMLKEGDWIALKVDGDGPAEGLSVEARAEGAVRGRLYHSPITFEGTIEDFDGSALFGSGSLSVTRFSASSPQSFVGSIALKPGRLAQNLAAYYFESEQTRTAFDLSVDFDREGRAIGAGALFFQALPGADEGFLGRVEESLRLIPSLGAYFAEGGTREAFLETELHDLFPESLGERGAAFECSCSRDRFASFFGSAKGDLLNDLAENGPWPVETVCHNCGSAYYFTREELEAMRDARRGRDDSSDGEN